MSTSDSQSAAEELEDDEDRFSAGDLDEVEAEEVCLPSFRRRTADASKPTRCLFSDELLASPAAALQRAHDVFGLDFLALRKARSPCSASQPFRLTCLSLPSRSGWTYMAASSWSTSCGSG